MVVSSKGDALGILKILVSYVSAFFVGEQNPRGLERRGRHQRPLLVHIELVRPVRLTSVRYPIVIRLDDKLLRVVGAGFDYKVEPLTEVPHEVLLFDARQCLRNIDLPTGGVGAFKEDGRRVGSYGIT